ncbi:hypothetical protein [Streptomyces sp. 2P-4]|uniref:hypothetical protein n=1 Tax=Streptomyces sp. 2P-4 TaxID=2931974 RepID=UPI00253FE75F|nr:hypothetical protein [Streptomyces sp. 2P-4]
MYTTPRRPPGRAPFGPRPGARTSPSADDVTSYTYLGGAAWAKSTDEFTKAEDRVHSVSRGYGLVQTRTGAADDPKTLTETRYFRGLDGKEVKDSAGAAVTDRDVFAGTPRETALDNGDDTAKLLTAMSVTPWVSALSATRMRAGLPDLVAVKSGTEKQSTRTTTAGGTRTVESTTHHDDLGMVDWVSETGDTAKTGDEKCTSRMTGATATTPSPASPRPAALRRTRSATTSTGASSPRPTPTARSPRPRTRRPRARRPPR